MSSGLPASGQLSFASVSVEILRSTDSLRTLNDIDVRTLFEVSSGQIALSNGHGKRWVTPGSQSFYSSGTFVVPRYEYLTVVITAGGGGATGYCGNDGFAYGYCGGAGGGGGSSAFYGPTHVVAYGGGGGGNGGQDYCPPSGASGGGSGGSVSIGGGAEGGYGCNRGGNGGYVSKTWNWTEGDAPAYGSLIGVTIGGGGGGGGGGENAPAASGGGSGSCIINWS